MILQKRPGLPEHLATIWEEIEEGVMPKIGPAGIEALCGQIHLQREAGKRISEEGLVVQDVKGNPVSHPAIAIEKQAQSEVRSWLDKFGRRTI